VQYVWPTVVWNVPLLSGGAGDANLSARLADVAERAFDQYVSSVLPRELEADPAFAKEFREADGSRVNLAFLRWQKRVFAKAARVPVEEIDWDGKPVPKIQGISYEWPELYNSQEFRVFMRKVQTMASSFLNSLSEDKDKHKFRAFAWAEVYRPGDFQRPHMHTGAAVAGMFFARYAPGPSDGQTLVFEDMRGLNPPFGRTHEIQPAEGELVLWPAWASHFLSPHPGNTTNVFLSVLLWPSGGAEDFDWEDDVTGDYIYHKKSSIKPKQQAGQGQPAGPGARRQEL